MTTDNMNYTMRLQRYLARSGVASRRGSERLISEGRVSVNGIIVRELGTKVSIDSDVVTVDGKRVELQSLATTLVLNKPKGYLTTMSDPYGRPCVAELVPKDVFPGLYPVGRLDVDTTGALLFTSDGDLGQALLHPSKHVDKSYIALISGIPSHDELERIRLGITLDDGPCAPADIEILERDSCKGTSYSHFFDGAGACVVKLTIHEGRKHQVKRMMSAIGYEVVELHRERFGPVFIGDVEEGSWRFATEEEQRSFEAYKRKAKGGDVL